MFFDSLVRPDNLYRNHIFPGIVLLIRKAAQVPVGGTVARPAGQ
jgi:hypothetical protein